MTTMQLSYRFLSAVFMTAATALGISCSDNDSLSDDTMQLPDYTGSVSLTATMNEYMTRSGLSKSETEENKALFYWNSGDQISVQTETADGTYSGAAFTNYGNTGSSTATFYGKVPAGSTLGKYAVYPYNENHQFTDTALIFHLPDSVTYSTVGTDIFSYVNANSYPTNSYPANSTNIPMLGTITDGEVSFKYLCGLAVIRIDKMPADSGTLTVTADKQISGDFAVDMAADTPVIATAYADTTINKQVTFTFSGATKDGVGVFYLPLPTGRYYGMKIKLSCGETTQTIPYSIYVSSGNVYAISLTTDSKGNLRNIQPLGENRYMINGHAFVDLGLDVLWAETNVGGAVSTTYAYSVFFYWGGTVANEGYGTVDDSQRCDWNTKTVMSAYDAATVNWGSGCRMATSDEFQALIDSCDWTRATENGIEGLRIKGKNSNTDQSIFMPAFGYLFTYYTDGYNDSGFYWTSSWGWRSYPLEFYFWLSGGTRTIREGSTYYQALVRPVAEKP